MVQDLSEDSVGCILFDDDASVCAGSAVRRTGRTAGVPVGEGFLGRVVNALGVPIDGGETSAPTATAQWKSRSRYHRPPERRHAA